MGRMNTGGQLCTQLVLQRKGGWRASEIKVPFLDLGDALK